MGNVLFSQWLPNPVKRDLLWPFFIKLFLFRHTFHNANASTNAIDCDFSICLRLRWHFTRVKVNFHPSRFGYARSHALNLKNVRKNELYAHKVVSRLNVIQFPLARFFTGMKRNSPRFTYVLIAGAFEEVEKGSKFFAAACVYARIYLNFSLDFVACYLCQSCLRWQRWY